MSDTTTTTTEQTRTETETTDVLAGLTDAQRQEINRRAANARRDGEQSAAAKLKADADKAKADEDAKREADEAAKRGEFDKVREGIERERDDFKGKAETAQQRADWATGVLADQLADRVKALDADPDLAKAYKADFPDGQEHDLREQMKWLAHPGTKSALAKATAETQDRRDALRGAAGVVPPARGDLTDAQRITQERQQLVASGRIPKI